MSSSTAGKTILVVDDEAPQRKLMRDALRGAGFQVLVASDYESALRIHQRHAGPIDVLVTDLSLPGKSGFDLADELLSLRPGLKVLFTSGPAGAELRRFHAWPANDSNFLEKPFQAAQLVERVRRLLDGCKCMTESCGGV